MFLFSDSIRAVRRGEFQLNTKTKTTVKIQKKK